MAKIKYKCDDHGHEFLGNDFTTDCPECGSTIQPSNYGSTGFSISKIKEIIQTNKLVFIALFLLVIFGVILNNCGGSNSNDELYTLDVRQVDGMPYLEISVKAYKKENEKSISRTLEPKEILSIIDSKVTIGSGLKNVNIKDNNKIYLCPNDTGYVGLIFRTKFDKKFKSLQNSAGSDELRKTASFSLRGISASEKAECVTEPLTTSEIGVSFIKGCKLQVQIKRNLKGKNVLVSINGKDGDFQQKLVWDMKPIINTRQSIWVYIEGEDKSTASEASRNGDLIPEGDCIPKDCSQIKSDFLSLAINFGKDPANRATQSAFQAFLNKNFTKQIIYLNNQQVDLSELQQKMSVSAKNYGSKFELQGNIALSDNCSSIVFRYQEI